MVMPGVIFVSASVSTASCEPSAVRRFVRYSGGSVTETVPAPDAVADKSSNWISASSSLAAGGI
jgi:hypothetical protein